MITDLKQMGRTIAGKSGFLCSFFELLNKKKRQEGSARNLERTNQASAPGFSFGAAQDRSRAARPKTESLSKLEKVSAPGLSRVSFR